MFTFYLWLKALKEGSALYGAATAMFYFYMVAAWGEPQSRSRLKGHAESCFP